MRDTRPLLALAAACLALAGAPAAGAQALFGRLALTVENPSGERLPGVAVTVTTDALESFREEGKTNKRGQLTLAFPDATRVYTLRLVLDGYAPLETSYKPKLQKTERQTITLVPRGQPSAQAGPQNLGGEGEVERVYSAAERFFNEGVEALRAGDRAVAEERFRAALERDGGMVAAHSALAGLLLDAEKHDEAAASARVVIASKPDDARAYRILYEASAALGRTEQAEAALRKLTELDDSGDAAALVYNEAVSALEVGDVERAHKGFEAALAIAPDLAPAHSALAVLHINQGRHAEAAAAAERVLELTPGDVKAMTIAWDAYRRMGDAGRESEARRRLEAADPGTLGKRLYAEGVDLFNRNETGDAIDRFEQVVALGSNPKAHYYLGLCHASRGANQAALDSLRRFVELAPDDPDAALASQMIDSLGG